jgi:hypothetical protein
LQIESRAALVSLMKFSNTDNNYLLRSKMDYFPKMPESGVSIFTGADLFTETQNLLLGDSTQRKKIRDFETFLSETFFNRKEVNIVPRIGYDSIHIKIGDEEKAIFDYGDGIQSIIILTYPLFFNKDKYCVFYYEEPEMHLHPGLQRVFFDTLRRPEFGRFQYFITTHSNHFLDLTLDCDDISVYTFEKKEEEKRQRFEIQNVASGDDNVLGLIGVRNSSVFLSNCTIWVEGITDRLYLRKYLEVYQKGKKVFKEDMHFSFVEYGGNNITHWSFLEDQDTLHSNINVDRLCGKLFLITDRDNAGLKKNGEANVKADKKYERHLKLYEKLKDRYYCLNAREIENLLTKEVVKKIVTSYGDENQSIDFSKFEKRDHSTEQLGLFIDNNVSGITRKFASKTGAINDKLNFCKRAIANINSIGDLSIEGRALTEKIYNFITMNNS